MKKIVTLEGIPRNDELKITERAQKLMDGVSPQLPLRNPERIMTS
jgi:hypothetical protein